MYRYPFQNIYEPLLVAHIVTCDGAISYNQSEAMSFKLPVSVMTWTSDNEIVKKTHSCYYFSLIKKINGW